MHWCPDETNALIAALGMFGPAVIWIRIKFKAIRTYLTLRRTSPVLPCQCGHDHAVESAPDVTTDSTSAVKVSN